MGNYRADRLARNYDLEPLRLSSRTHLVGVPFLSSSKRALATSPEKPSLWLTFELTVSSYCSQTLDAPITPIEKSAGRNTGVLSIRPQTARSSVRDRRTRHKRVGTGFDSRDNATNDLLFSERAVGDPSRLRTCVGGIDRSYEASANRLRQQGHSPSYPLMRAENADGCGSVMIALNANGARCA